MSSSQFRVGKLAAKNRTMASQFMNAVRSLKMESTPIRRSDDDYGVVAVRRGVPGRDKRALGLHSHSTTSISNASWKQSIGTFRGPSKGSLGAARPSEKDVTLFTQKRVGTLPFHPARGEIRNQFTTRSYSSTEDDLAHKVSLEIQNDLMPLDDSTRKMLSFKSPSASRIRKSEENIAIENLGLNPTRYKKFISENMLNMKAIGVQKQQLGFSRRMEHRSPDIPDNTERGSYSAQQSVPSPSASRDYFKYKDDSYDRTRKYSPSEEPIRRLDEFHSSSNIDPRHYSASQRAVIEQREFILEAKRNAIKEAKSEIGFKPVKFEMPKSKSSAMNQDFTNKLNNSLSDKKYDYDNKFQEIREDDRSDAIQSEKKLSQSGYGQNSGMSILGTNTNLKYSKQSATNFQAGQGRAPPRRVYSTNENNNWGLSPYGESSFSVERRSSAALEEGQAWSLPRRVHSVDENTEDSQNNRSHSAPSRTNDISGEADTHKQSWQYSNKSATMNTAGFGRTQPQRVFLVNDKSYAYNSNYRNNQAPSETAFFARNEQYANPPEASMPNQQFRTKRNISTATKIRSVGEPQKPMYKIAPIDWYKDDEEEPVDDQRGERTKSHGYDQHEEWKTSNAGYRANNREQRHQSYHNSGEDNNYSDFRTAYRNELINAQPDQYWRYDS